MSRVRGKNTSPELKVRRAAHGMGLRFRLHRRDLPGTPDLVFPRLRTVVFVHGCFWHRHHGCRKASVPGSRTDFWNEKFDRNVGRDERVAAELRGLGWKVVVVWECEAKNPVKLADIIQRELISIVGDQVG